MRICIADLDRETTKTLADYIKQGGKLTEGFTIEAPGKGVVDESIWSRAKKAAEEQGQGENYAYISSIYQSMGGKYKKKSSKDAYDIIEFFDENPQWIHKSVNEIASHLQVSEKVVTEALRLIDESVDRDLSMGESTHYSNAYPDAEDFDDNPKMNRKHKDEPNSELASINEGTIQASINRVRASQFIDFMGEDSDSENYTQSYYDANFLELVMRITGQINEDTLLRESGDETLSGPFVKGVLKYLTPIGNGEYQLNQAGKDLLKNFKSFKKFATSNQARADKQRRSDFNPNLAQDEEDFDRRDHKKPEFGSETPKGNGKNGKDKTPEGAPSKLSRKTKSDTSYINFDIGDRVEVADQKSRDRSERGEIVGKESGLYIVDLDKGGTNRFTAEQLKKTELSKAFSKHISISRHLLDQTFHFNPKTSKDLFDSQTVIQASMIGNNTLQYRNLLIKGDFIGDNKDVFVPTDYDFSTEMAEMHQARKEEAANIVIANYPQVIEGSVDLITQIKNKLLKGVLITDTRLQRINTKRVDSNGNFRDGEVEWVMVAEDPLKHTSANLYLTLTAKNGSLEDTGFFRDTLGKYYTLSSDSVKQLLQ